MLITERVGTAIHVFTCYDTVVPMYYNRKAPIGQPLFFIFFPGIEFFYRGTWGALFACVGAGIARPAKIFDFGIYRRGIIAMSPGDDRFCATKICGRPMVAPTEIGLKLCCKQLILANKFALLTIPFRCSIVLFLNVRLCPQKDVYLC